MIPHSLSFLFHRNCTGKIAFDRWEKENEVGRKILASLRTMWLVEERSLKKTGLGRSGRRSQFRLVQMLYDAAFLSGRAVRSVVKSLPGSNRSITSFRDFFRGLERPRLVRRLGAATTALISMIVFSALFTLSPFLVGSVAVMVGFMYGPEFYLMAGRLVQDESPARSRSSNTKTRSKPISSPDSLAHEIQWPWQKDKDIDPKRYHFFTTKDGRKRYYRTGQSVFGPAASQRHVESTNEKKSLLPWWPL
jgi:hypothetical protein